MKRWGQMLAMVWILSGCMSQTPEPTLEPTTEPTEAVAQPTIRVGLLADQSGLDDGGFNELIYDGSQVATQRFGGILDATELQADDYNAEINHLANSDYDVIITSGAVMTDATRITALVHPETHFIGIDQYQETPIANVTGIIFPDDQAGYLAGYLAAQISQTATVGGVFGPEEVGPIQAFANGFENGALAGGDVNVIRLHHPGPLREAFADQTWGASTAEMMIEQGADVVFAAAGDTGRGALIEVAERTSPDTPLYCIGVDTDQWTTTEEARPCLITSATKDIPTAVEQVLLLIVGGTPPTGNYIGPVGLAPFHDFEPLVSPELQEQLISLETDLLTGVVATGHVSADS